MKIHWRIFLGVAAVLSLVAVALRHALPTGIMLSVILNVVFFAPAFATSYLIAGLSNEHLYQWLSWVQLLVYSLLIATEFRGRRVVLFFVFGIHGIVALVWTFLLATYRP